MLVTDVGDEMCWWQLWDVGDGFDRFCHQHTLSFCKASGTNIPKMSPISKFCHFHEKIATKIKSPTSTCHQHLCCSSKQFQKLPLRTTTVTIMFLLLRIFHTRIVTVKILFCLHSVAFPLRHYPPYLSDWKIRLGRIGRIWIYLDRNQCKFISIKSNWIWGIWWFRHSAKIAWLQEKVSKVQRMTFQVKYVIKCRAARTVIDRKWQRIQSGRAVFIFLIIHFDNLVFHWHTVVAQVQTFSFLILIMG